MICMTSTMGCTPEIVVPTPAVEPVKEPIPLPPPGGPMLIISGCTNCTAPELEFLRKAEGKMNEVVLSDCFQTKLASSPLIQTENRTPQEVVASLIHASVKIDIEMYYSLKRVLGYTLPNAKREWINRRYMKSWGVCDLGSLLAHETSHKVGYGHSHSATKTRPQSVPYTINRVFESCCKE